MAISSLVPVESSGVNAISATATTSGYLYYGIADLPAGGYTASSNTSTVVVNVVKASKEIVGTVTATTSSVSFNVTSDAAGFYFESAANNVLLTLTQVSTTVSPTQVTINSGTVDTVTTSGTYSQTGILYAMVVGGGGGGGSFSNNGWSGQGAGGGGSGGLTSGLVYSNGNYTVTIGNGGNSGSSGGATTFATNITANGGNGGGSNSGGTGNNGDRGNGGTPGGGSGGARNSGGVGYASAAGNIAIKNGTTGGGAAGANNSPGGSGIGTGGNGGNNGPGGAATGYGAGGGGANGINAPANGGAGSPGVVYILRGF
jgi:hypothetical protein